MMQRLSVLVLVAWSLAAACERGSADGGDGLEQVILVVLVQDHRERPLAGAGVVIDGKPAWETGDEGTAEIALSNPDGSQVDVSVVCPAELVNLENALERITVRRLRPVFPEGHRFAPIEIEFVCVPALREHLLVVRTDGRAGLPVLLHGEQAAVTDASGTAHIAIRHEPGEEIEVVLDTSNKDELRPRSPSRRLRLPEQSRIILFDQRFEERQGPVMRKRQGVALPRRL